MDEAQLEVVIPLLPEKAFVDYLESQSFEKQVQQLSYATSKQKEQYLDRGLLNSPELQKWESIKADLTKKIETFRQDPSQENLNQLDKGLPIQTALERV